MPEETVGAEPCVALGATSRTLDSYPTRQVALGSLPVTRALPVRERRLVGPWCFLDRFGPQTFFDQRPMDVAPHPHIGLQTVTWLVAGEVRHYDSLGSEALARPGGVNVMTAGGELGLDLDPVWEHAVLILAGDASIEGQPLEPRRLYYLGTNRTEVGVSSRAGGRLLLVGGPPFPETILMWWNFVARTPAEIAQARADWEARVRFGEVAAYQGPRLEAPALARFAAPNPVS